MPPRSQQSAPRRKRGSGTRVSVISDASSTPGDNGASETGAAAKRRRADSPRKSRNAGSGSTTRNRSRSSASTVSSHPHLDTLATPSYASRMSNKSDPDTDEDGTDVLQRFSNVSVWPHAQQTSPPTISSTPPPSPPRASIHVEDAQRMLRGSLPHPDAHPDLSLECDPAFVLPECSSKNKKSPFAATPPSKLHKPSQRFPSALLSELLLQEAACAEVAAAAAAGGAGAGVQQQGYGSFVDRDGGSTGPLSGARTSLQQLHLPPAAPSTLTSQWRRQSRDSDAALFPGRSPESPSPQSPMGYLTVCIGVVPPPGSGAPCESSAPRKTSWWWPWGRTAQTPTSHLAADGIGEAASDKASHIKKGGGSDVEPNPLTSLHEATGSVHRLRPRRLYVSDQPHTASVDRDKGIQPAPAQPLGGTATGLTDADVSTGSSFHGSGPIADVVGWTGVFADVPLVLPGAQQAPHPEATGAAISTSNSRHTRDGDCERCSQSDALVCNGVASISVVLA
ncbi:hypothetical protein JKF63_07873 [Porcisia hertigi]|uniref:Uncharacterized protein n=1 Tax=Porcisia hertigi TaxID=2761500 RepID=A0A836LJS3_9TRYP|nr:hypothetical protein JKF63_07873 [Porcisia hertigi]